MNENTEDNTEDKKKIILFGRDVSEIPCFKNSFLYGIGSGIGFGLAAFMISSRPKISSHVGMCAFIVTTSMYWVKCRYEYETSLKQIEKLKAGLQNHALYEGTPQEAIIIKTEDA